MHDATPPDNREVSGTFTNRRPRIMAKVTNQEGLDALRQHTPQMHDLLLAKSGKVVIEDMTEFEMVQELKSMGHEILTVSGEPRYEVHYVNKDRELDVLEGDLFLSRREQEYKELESIR